MDAAWRGVYCAALFGLFLKSGPSMTPAGKDPVEAHIAVNHDVMLKRC